MTGAVISSRNRDQWSKASFWGKLCPDLTIIETKKAASTSCEKKVIDAEQCRQCLIDDGYAMIEEPFQLSLIQKLRKGIETLHNNKYPASFILLFHETWELARLSRALLKQVSHEANSFHFDILAWYIESNGFSPHRDRQPQDVAKSFHTSGESKFVTHWIALSDATTENSCLYVIPKPQDPGYMKGDNDIDADAEDPLRKALPTKAAFQNIRALPRPQGYSLVFDHRIIHWGSTRYNKSRAPPRIAISYVCSDPSHEKPYVDTKYFTNKENPPFSIRLLLVCAQLLIYYQRFDLPKETIRACYEYCKEHESELEETYRQKVFVEFVNAMKESCNVERTKESGEAPRETTFGTNTGDDDADDDEDAVLEEMLNAEEGGYGEFEDDYDNTKDDGDDDEEEEIDGACNDDVIEEQNVSLFGSKSTDQPISKRLKRDLSEK